jgi:hypothetical protein
MEELAAAWELSNSEPEVWTAPPPAASRFFSVEAAAQQDAMQRRTAETPGDGEATPIVLEIPAAGDGDWLEARLAAAERELQRVEMRTHGENGDLRNARRREIAEAVRHALGDREMATHFDLRVDNGLFAFQRRRPGALAATGPIRGEANVLIADSAGRIRAAGPVRPDDRD